MERDKILYELRELVSQITSWVGVLLLGTAFFFMFSFVPVERLRGAFLPYPTSVSSAVRVFERAQRDLLPEGVQLIVTNPASAFIAQVAVSFFLSFLLTFPYLLYALVRYLSPALYGRERKALLLVVLPSTLLFFLGCAFAYTLLIPFTFRTLYPYATLMGALPFFSVHEFITLVFGIMVVTGIMFLLPVCMVLLTRVGIVPVKFWRENWRYACMGFLVLSAILTPDGTGVTMLLLSLPLTGLYATGAVVSGWVG